MTFYSFILLDSGHKITASDTNVVQKKNIHHEASPCLSVLLMCSTSSVS